MTNTTQMQFTEKFRSLKYTYSTLETCSESLAKSNIPEDPENCPAQSQTPAAPELEATSNIPAPNKPRRDPQQRHASRHSPQNKKYVRASIKVSFAPLTGRSSTATFPSLKRRNLSRGYRVSFARASRGGRAGSFSFALFLLNGWRAAITERERAVL